MKLSLVIQTPEVEQVMPVALLSGSFEEKITKAARMGVEGLELMTVDPQRLEARRILGQLETAGLQAAAVASGALARLTGLTLLHTDAAQAARAQERLRDLVRFASSIQAPLVTIGSFRGFLSSIKTGGRERLVAALRQAAAFAGEAGVRLAFEPLNRYETDVIRNAQEGLALLEEVESPALGLLLDTYHVNIEEASWTEPFERVMSHQKLFHVHLGDNNRLPPGKGLIDFRAILSTLQRVSYTGYLSAELLALPDPDTAAQQTVNAIRPLL